MRDQSEVIKDHISRAINKIEALLRGEGELLREDQDNIKFDVRDKNTQVKDEIRDKIASCEMKLNESRRHIGHSVLQFKHEIQTSIANLKKHQDGVST